MLLRQLVLVIGVCALLSAALRLAARLTTATGDGLAPDGEPLDRVIVAAVIAAGFAVCWTLVLGLFGLAGDTAALVAGPVAAWLMAHRALPVARPTIASYLSARWGRGSRLERATGLAVAGLLVGWIVAVAREPAFDIDALSYHLPDVIGWLRSGHAGSVQTITYDFPVGYYPVTNEVLMTWVLGISRSFAPLAVWPVAAGSLMLLSLWRLVRLLRVPRAAAAATVAAIAALPVFILALNSGGPDTDLPAVAWLGCAAALAADTARRPRLLGPALLAAGLGIGTKTTVAPLALIVLAIGAWQARSRLRAVRVPIGLGGLAALAVGAPWYIRATIAHGWPLWPFSSGPTGDPLPHTMSLFDVSFLSRPKATVSLIGNDYLKWLAGGLGLIAAVPLVAAVTRSRAAVASALLALAAVLAWMVAPFTGLARLPVLEPLAVSTVRYTLAPLTACAVALAIAARDAGPGLRAGVVAVLGASAAGSFAADIVVGSTLFSGVIYVIAGALVGGALGLVGPGVVSPRAQLALAGACAALAIAFLTLSATRWLWREATDRSYGSPVLAFMLQQPGFLSGHQPIASAPAVLATLAGPSFKHPISLIPARESCRRTRARLRDGWVVLRPREVVAGVTTAFDATRCLERDRPIYDDGTTVVYGPL